MAAGGPLRVPLLLLPDFGGATALLRFVGEFLGGMLAADGGNKVRVCAEIVDGLSIHLVEVPRIPSPDILSQIRKSNSVQAPLRESQCMKQS